MLMGSVITRDAAFGLRIKLTHMRLGGRLAPMTLKPFCAPAPRSIALPGSRCLGARWRLWCCNRPEFAQVLHPALSSSPDTRIGRRCASMAPGGRRGLFSVIWTRFSQSPSRRVCDALQLFRLGYSWGRPISLVVPL